MSSLGKEKMGPSQEQLETNLPPRKRTRTDNPSGNKTQHNKGTRSVGKLTKLIDMPLDVFYEIASHLHPLDLLHLMRTSKMLRSILHSRSSTSVWKAAFTTIDPSIAKPPIPPDMHLPQFAALLFDRICSLCGRQRANWVDYAIQLRLCKPCYKTNIRTGSSILEMHRPLPASGILRLVPCEMTQDRHVAETLLKPSSHGWQQMYYVKDVDNIVDEWRRTPKTRKSTQQLEERMVMRQLSGFTVMLWMHSLSLEKQFDDVAISKARSACVTAKLQELGYSQRDFPEDDAIWDKLVNEAKPLTDRIWISLRPKLVVRIALERDRRTEEELVDRIATRLTHLLHFYSEYLEENIPVVEHGLLPNNHDFCNLPSIAALARRDDAQGDVSMTDFGEVTERMLVDISAYKQQAKEMILESARAQPRSSSSRWERLSGVSADDALNQCCSYFSCHVCYHYNYATFAESHAHWRAMHPDEAWTSQGSSGFRRIGYTSDLPYHATIVLASNGIPKKTTQDVLNEWVREGRLYCTCGDPSMPAPKDLNFAKLIEHLIDYKNYDWRRLCEIKKNPNPNHVLKAMHTMSGAQCDVKFLAEGADTAPGHARFTISDAVRAKVEQRLAKRPAAAHALALGVQDQGPLLCRICKGMHKQSTDVRDNELPDSPEGIVWHLQRCHDKEFEKRDILFART